MRFMPVDIKKVYFEIQRLRKEVRKAERDLIISFARPPGRSVRAAGMTGHSSQAANPPMPLLKRALN